MFRKKNNHSDRFENNFSRRYNMGRTPGQFNQGSRAHEHGSHQDYYPKNYEFDLGYMDDYPEPQRPNIDSGLSGGSNFGNDWPPSTNGLGRQNQPATNQGSPQGQGYNQGHDYFRSHTEGQHYGKGPKSYRRPDARIFEDVCEALRDHGNIDATNVEVHVRDGIVVLSGHVDSRFMKRMAEEALDGLPGIQDIRNELTISRVNIKPSQ